MPTMTFKKLSCLTVLLPLIALASTTVHALTTIVVDSTEDLADSINHSKHTCSFTSGAFYYPAPDGKCTLRRATLEAGVRPDADRPVRIEFDIPTTDPGYDPALKIWEVQIDESYPWVINRRFISDDGGQVTIDGDTQPGGRNWGPKIMVNTNRDNNPIFGRSLEIYTSNNILRNLGFHGGGQIILYEGSNKVSHVWMGLNNSGGSMKLASTASTQARRSLARGGIIMPNEDSDNNHIHHNTIIGAVERAIRVTSGGDNNLIEFNDIGMNRFGEVPLASYPGIDCTRDPDYSGSLWYGGEGIQVTGNMNTVRNNTLAGLHKTQTTNETPPIALEIYGTGNTVRNNVIGRDKSDNAVGVCGQGILVGGDETVVTQNTLFFSRNGFDPTDIDTEFDSAIITQSFIGQDQDDPWIKVFDNHIDGGDQVESTYHSYRFSSPGVPIELRQFTPAKVISIKNTLISGTNGDDSILGYSGFCPDCTVYLYVDDRDDRIESFELIGTARADANGDWSTTLSRSLEPGEGIRTQSMSNAADVMHIFGAKTTSELSNDLYLPSRRNMLPFLLNLVD